MQVEASGYQFIFPQQCVCCGSAPDTCLTVSASKTSGQRVVRTKTNTWDFPYCSHCLQHIGAAEQAKTIAIVVFVIVLIIAFYLGSWLGGVLAVLGSAGALVMYVKLMVRAKAMLKDTCVSLGKAVAFLGWDGTYQSFEIVSPRYAREFMIANKRKLINVSQVARALLGDEVYDKRANNIQSAKRYRK